MKRYLKIFILLVLCIVMLTGCKKEKESKLNPNDPVVIKIWYYYNGSQKKAFDNMVTEFNSTKGKEMGIIVEGHNYGGISELADSIRDSANNKVGANKLPDIFSGYSDIAKEIDDMGMVADIETYLTHEEEDKYVSAYIEEGRLDGTGSLKIFPVAKSTEVLVLNKTIWDKFSAEMQISREELKTWEGIARIAEKYFLWSEGEAFFGRDAFANYMFVGSKQLGKEILINQEEDTSVVIDKEIMRRLWDNYYVPYIKGYYKNEGKFASDDAKTGDIVAFVASTSGGMHFPTEVYLDNGTSYPMECEIMEIPNFEGCEPYAVQQGAGMVVTKTDEIHEYASVIFLKWFSEIERNLEFSTQVGYLPVMKEANNVDVINKALEKSTEPVNDNVRKSLITAAKQCKEYSLFTNQVVANSYKYRDIVNISMIDKAKEDRKVIDEMVQKAMDDENIESKEMKFNKRKELEDLYYKEFYEVSADKIFEEWLEKFKAELYGVKK